MLRDGPAVGPVVAVASVVAVAVGGVGVRAAWRAGWPVTATATCGLVGLLVSPVSWSHHWVWTTPLVAGIVLEVGTTALGVVAAALGVTVSVGAHWALPQWDTRELSWTWWMQLVGNGYVWLGLVTLGAVTAAGVRATHRCARPGAGPATATTRREPAGSSTSRSAGSATTRRTGIRTGRRCSPAPS